MLNEREIMEDKKSTYRKTKTITIQERDIVIFRFLSRVGYANIEQVNIALNGTNNKRDELAILRRLYILRRFNYIKVFSTYIGNYYALDKKCDLGTLPLIKSIKLDQLEHHDFLTDLFLFTQQENILSEREVIAKYKVVGRKGKIPDMVINDWIIEFERSSKSVTDTMAVVNYWTIEQNKNLCVIYNNNEIRNRYTSLLNPKLKLLDKKDYKNILTTTKILVENNQVSPELTTKIEDTKTSILPKVVNSFLDKYR
jgi:hypothetical protein